MKAWQRALALLVLLGGVNAVTFFVGDANNRQGLYANSDQVAGATGMCIVLSVLLLPLLLTLAILPRRPLALRLASGSRLRMALASWGHLIMSLIPGLLIAFAAIFWAVPHHYPAALAWLLALCVAAWAFVADSKRLFAASYKSSGIIYFSLLALASLLLVVDGDRLSSLKPTDKEIMQARLENGLGDASIEQLLIAKDGALLAQVSEGWFRSTDNGQQWQIAFPDGMRKIRALLILPKSGAYLGVDPATGILKSTDAGKSWQVLLALQGTDASSALQLAPDGTLYFNWAAEILSSKDEGATWSESSTFLDGKGKEMEPIITSFAAAADGTAYAFVEYEGLFKSVDRGLTWKPHAVDDRRLADESAWHFMITADDQLIVGFEHAGILRSADKGAHWQRANVKLDDDDYYPSRFVQVSSKTLYAQSYSGPLRSKDGGITWLPVGPDNRRDLTILAEGKGGTLFAAASKGLYRSDNHGESWTAVTPPPKELRQPSQYLLKAITSLL